MNIFYLDHSVEKCAKYMNDQHIHKMPLESMQMLSAALLPEDKVYDESKSFSAHGCTIWVKKSKSNFNYLLTLLKAMLNERFFRFGTRYNALEILIPYVERKAEDVIFPCEDITPLYLAMPLAFQSDNPVKAYRNYYRYLKSDSTWTKRGRPDWLCHDPHNQ